MALGVRLGCRSRRDVLRDILAGSLGASLLTACDQTGLEPLKLRGALKGPNVKSAHRLQSPPPSAWPTSKEQTDIAIIGAGVSGLAAAWRLRTEQDISITLIDLEETPGGTSRGVRTGCSQPHPWGAHYLPVPLSSNPVLITLLEELGALAGKDEYGEPLGAEERLVRAPAERLFDRGRWYEGLFLEARASPKERAELTRFELAMQRFATERDERGTRVFAVPVHRSSLDAKWLALDHETAGQWLDRQGFESPRLRWLIDYACRDEFGLRTEKTSAWAMLWYFAARLHPHTKKGRPFLAWPEGNSALTQHMFERCRSAITYHGNTLTQGIRRVEQGVGIDVLLQDGRGAFRTLRAKQVILAVPSFVATRLVDLPRPLAQPTFGAWVVANLHLSRRPTSHGFPQAWDNVLYDSPSLGYVDAGFQRGDDHGPTVWTYYFALAEGDPRQDRAALIKASFEDWSEIVVRDLERAHPDLRNCLERIDIWRWGHAMSQPRPGAVSAALAQTDPVLVPGVTHAHSDRSAIATFEEAFDHGVTAADIARRDLKGSS